MSIIIIGVWLCLLAILVKIGVFKRWALWMKLSPIGIYLIYFLIIAIPMNFQAPQGAAMILRESVPISPAVSGTVATIPVSSGIEIPAGTVLFTIDPGPFEAAAASIKAKLILAETRLEQARTLILRDAGRKADVQQYEAEMAELTADLEAARWNLEQTVVRAPRTGVIPNLALEEGTQVNPNVPVMTVIESDRYALVGRIAQNYIRHVKPGQKADVVFKLLPGEVIPATVKRLVNANPVGQVTPSDRVMDSQEWSEQPFIVELEISPDVELPDMPAGAFGTVAIYTADMSSFGELIRAIMLRTETWLNFL